MANAGIIGLLVFNAAMLYFIVVLLRRIEKKIDVSEFWKELLDAKVKSIIYKELKIKK